jgi:hypothetical protein
MVSPTHAGLSGHCSVRRIEWCSFFFSGGVEGCWCFCSLFSCFISFFIDMHDDHAGDNNNCPPLLNVPSQPAANDGQFPSLHAIWPSFVFSTAHCHPMRVIARPLVQEKAQARFPPSLSPSAGARSGFRSRFAAWTPDGAWAGGRASERASHAERLARLAGLTSPSRRHLLVCAALCDREAARVRRPLCPPATHTPYDYCCCKKAQHLLE